MKIGIDMGHSLSGAGTGAIGIVREVDINRQIGNHLISMLKEKGHTVINCTVDYANSTDNQLIGIVNKANAQALDLFVSIHLNTGGGEGTEVYVYNGNYNGKAANKQIAAKLSTEIAASCNFRNRGAKEANFYVLRGTIAPACLVEVCFIDSKNDIAKLNVYNVAKAMFKAITGVEYVKTPVTPTVTHEVVKTGPYTEYGGYGDATILVDKIYFRDKYCTHCGKITGEYTKGETVRYTKVCITDKYTWISWVSAATGATRWMPIRDMKTGETWVSIK